MKQSEIMALQNEPACGVAIVSSYSAAFATGVALAHGRSART